MQIQHRSDQPGASHGRRRVLESKGGRGSHIHRRTADNIWWESQPRRRETLPLSLRLSVHRGQSARRVRSERISGQRGRRVLEQPEQVSLGEIAQAEAVAGGGGRAGCGNGHSAAGGIRQRFLAHLCAQREEHMVLRDGARDVDGAGGFGEGVFFDWGCGVEASDGGGGGEGEGLWAYADFWAWGPRGYCEEGCHDGAVQCTSSQ
jgi:hypothetical protein